MIILWYSRLHSDAFHFVQQPVSSGQENLLSG